MSNTSRSSLSLPLDQEIVRLKQQLRMSRKQYEFQTKRLLMLNQELHIINQELKRKLEANTLDSTNLQNLYNSAELSLIILDNRLCIDMFTPTVCELFDLVPSDLGRPLAQISHRLRGADLLTDAATILVSPQTIEREVVTSDNQIYMLRLLPYAPNGHNIAGVVLIFYNRSMRSSVELALHQTNHELERKVEQRTSELIQVNGARQELLQRLVSAQEDERQRIARELHDSLGQFLSALMIRLANLANKVSDLPEISADLTMLYTVAKEIDGELDRITMELRPAVLSNLSLVDALQEYVEEWTEIYGIPVELLIQHMDDLVLPALIETTIYRVVQEGLTNVTKHAQANQVSILLARRDKVLRLILEDNGVGFDLNAVEHEGEQGRQVGLIGMRERAALIGGSFTIESELGSSTTLYLTIPY